MRSAAAVAAFVLALAPALGRAAEPAAPKPDAPAPKSDAPNSDAPPKANGPAPKADVPPGHPQMPKQGKPADTNKTLYAIGLAVANSLDVFSLSAAELDTVLKGLRDGWAGKPKFPLDAQMQMAVNDLARTRGPKAAEKAAAREKEQGATYLAKAAKESGAKKSPSGAIVIPIKEGTGASPAATDKVKVHYTGTLVSGRVFDSSVQRGPAEFPLNQVIKCWTEGLQLMKVGGKAKIVCPSEIAYGAQGNQAIPGNAVLTFDVELLDIVKEAKEAPAK
jgi:FKBP-type peptidyl-prolyl cis-trans isomerase